MLIFDVNILVYAHREDSVLHKKSIELLRTTASSREIVGFWEPILVSFLRIVTNPKIIKTPSMQLEALGFVEDLWQIPVAVKVAPGERYWSALSRLLISTNATGNHISDAMLAALAIEHQATLVTFDRDFTRFPGLRYELLTRA
jgi:uncharacterized protein